MDSMDIKILKLLENDGRITHEEIGRRLNISRPAIHKRIEKLRDKRYMHEGKLLSIIEEEE